MNAVETHYLEDMTTISKVWYTHEEQVPPVTFKVLKEHTEKENERPNHGKNYDTN